MRPADSLDVAIVSLGSTYGLRHADDLLLESLRRAGANAAVVSARPQVNSGPFPVVDFNWARACRSAAYAALGDRPRSIIYSTTTAALFWPRPGAIRFDAPNAQNRSGRQGFWQRPLERRRVQQSPLLLPWSSGSLSGLDARSVPKLVVPVPVEPSGDTGTERDIAAITYAGSPIKKGLPAVLDAFASVRRPGEELVVAGTDEAELRATLLYDRLMSAPGVRLAGRLDRDEYRALLRRSKVYVTAPVREDYGIAQLEALVDGCRLVTTPTPGPYAALPVAQALDPRYVASDLSSPLRTALNAGSDTYHERAQAVLHAWSPTEVDRLVANELLPRLLDGSGRT
jgi:glycosyltransferase involved in cell wall biosynthesis